MRLWNASRVVLAVVTLVTFAHAHTRDECVDASTRAQHLRDEQALTSARKELLVCADASCPAVVRRDCSGWLDEVERDLPSLAITLESASGTPPPHARVLIDGAPIADGVQSVPVDPGAHVVRVEADGHAAVEVAVTAARGAKDLPVRVRLVPTPEVARMPRAPASVARSSPLVPLGWAVAGVGAASLVLGAVFGGLALDSKSAAACDASLACDPELLARARAQALVSTVGFVAAVALGATGIVLWVVGRRAERAGAQIAFAPALDGASLSVTGRF